MCTHVLDPLPTSKLVKTFQQKHQPAIAVKPFEWTPSIRFVQIRRSTQQAIDHFLGSHHICLTRHCNSRFFVWCYVTSHICCALVSLYDYMQHSPSFGILYTSWLADCESVEPQELPFGQSFQLPIGSCHLYRSASTLLCVVLALVVFSDQNASTSKMLKLLHPNSSKSQVFHQKWDLIPKAFGTSSYIIRPLKVLKLQVHSLEAPASIKHCTTSWEKPVAK